MRPVQKDLEVKPKPAAQEQNGNKWRHTNQPTGRAWPRNDKTQRFPAPTSPRRVRPTAFYFLFNCFQLSFFLTCERIKKTLTPHNSLIGVSLADERAPESGLGCSFDGLVIYQIAE
ncbi:unnamed protein product [Pleuronectes platessa]|uniref:Uncharacterized protein n=1 Tax=Pleuronectes platessa TaxID=8262 RepID=A0A9N7VJW5_PLEPL|nr:unnamed protein product [Pleuronectes platessa]